MIRYISEQPMIAVIPPSSQKDRLDTYFYDPIFDGLTEKLESAAEKLKSLEEISVLITDGTHQTPKYTSKEEGILFLSSTNITENGINLDDAKYITKHEHDLLKSSHPKPGDILVSVAGNIGTACVFPNSLPECSVLRSVAIIRLKEGWNSKFVACFINSELGSKQVLQLQKGIAVKTFRLGEIKEFKVPELSKDDQDNIVLRYDAISSLNKELISSVSKLKDSKHRIADAQLDATFANELGLEHFPPYRKQKVFLRDGALIERLDVSANHPDYTRLA